jgi:CRISPR-associated protein Csm2
MPNSEIQTIIQKDEPEKLVTLAEAIGRRLALDDKLTTSQIRNIFGEARKIQARWNRDRSERTALVLLQPKLAYQAARHRQVDHLKSCLTDAINAVVQPGPTGSDRESVEFERFRRFMDFFEAILAYHKASGGRD